MTGPAEHSAGASNQLNRPASARSKKPPPTAEDFLAQVLHGPLVYTSGDIAELTGVDLLTIQRLWRAMGFADVGSARVFTKTDVEALRAAIRLVEKKLFSLEEVIELTRSIGQATARLAEWQTNTISRTMIERGVLEREGSLFDTEIPAIMRESKIIQPSLERLIIYAWRRQMAASASRSSDVAASGDALTGQLTVAFADLVGFTRLSRQLPDNELARLVETFETVSSDVVATTGARLVKTLGDEVLFTDASVETLAETAIRLHEVHSKNQEIPKMRIGMATGVVISRMGDVFGTTVNRASRLTVMARPGSTFVDATTMDELGESEKYRVNGVRLRQVRGFGLMRAWSLSRAK